MPWIGALQANVKRSRPSYSEERSIVRPDPGTITRPVALHWPAAEVKFNLGHDIYHLLSLAKSLDGILQRPHVSVPEICRGIVEPAKLPGQRRDTLAVTVCLSRRARKHRRDCCDHYLAVAGLEAGDQDLVRAASKEPPPSPGPSAEMPVLPPPPPL
jgi:hypothetical protein